MGSTITEKILAEVAGKSIVKPGDEIMARPDFVHSYDFPGYTDAFFREMKDEFGLEAPPAPERFALFIDHLYPPQAPKEEDLHIITRDWAGRQGIPLFERRGIGHQVAAEVGYAVPGRFIVHFDGHISQLGAFGMLALGLRRNVLEAFVREKISIQVPATTKVNLQGRIPRGVLARDIFHSILAQFGPSFCRFQVLEIGGPAVSELSMASRQTICGLAMFTGATTAIVNPDDCTDSALSQIELRLKPRRVQSDANAHYSQQFDLDLDSLEPLVVAPPNPANVHAIHDFEGLEINVGYIGSCASGRLEDLRVAADILKDRKVKQSFQLYIVPTSRLIMQKAADEGILGALIKAGAFITSPSCDYCFGHIGTMTAGQKAISTGTLNVPGRMGSPDSEIYLASPASVAAAAVEGQLVDPRRFL
jgi:3-isopropylmalate/(R)-2-methylmalate dehydratase large subunit